MLKMKNSAAKILNFNKIHYFRFSKTNVRIRYTEPLDIRQTQTVTPARGVPSQLERPDYVKNKNMKTPMRQRSIIKNKVDLENFRVACKIAAGALKTALENIKEEMTTDDIDEIVHNYIVSQNAYPSAIGYMGFPKSLCTSVNEVVCHGIPNKRKLKSGDYINMDITAFYGGFHGDTSAMACIGAVHPDVKKLIKVTREALFKAISICKPGVKVKKIGETIENYVRSFNFTPCMEFAGHGVGQQMHMLPSVMHTIEENHTEDVMEEGMAFTIEPIVMMHDYDQLYMWEDNWTVVCPNNPSAQWEHVVLITKDGHEILTLRENEENILF